MNSAQLSCHVANSTSVDIHCKFKQRADEEECEEDLPLWPKVHYITDNNHVHLQ